MNAHTTIPLADAIAIVKAAGYSVTKPKATRKTRLSTVGPTFVAEWSDGVTTRMTIHTSDEKLDTGRAVRVSRYAYDSRTKGTGFAFLTAGHFERAGAVLRSYQGAELNKQLP